MKEAFVEGQQVLNRGACKLHEYNWMKDYEGERTEGTPLIAEVRFKNDHKDFYTYPEELDLHEGDLVAVEAAIGHDIGIVTLVGPLVEKQMKRKRYRTPLEEMRKGGLAPHVADYLHVLRLDDCPQAYGVSGSDKLEYLSNRDAY